jgi:hypothetical protein
VTLKCPSQSSNNTLSEHKSEELPLQAACLRSQLHIPTNISSTWIFLTLYSFCIQYSLQIKYNIYYFLFHFISSHHTKSFHKITLHQHVKKNQLDAHLILGIFRQPLDGLESNPSRTTSSHLTIIISTICCIHTVVPPDDGPRYAQNM